jgi:hypothetical protein
MSILTGYTRAVHVTALQRRRALAFRQHRRAEGLCVRCGSRRPPVNPRTGRLQWDCVSCRARVNARNHA